MRDVHGKYLDIKAIADNGPSWASGCEQCECGIASAPPLTGVAPLHLERLCQAIEKSLVFCECKAGEVYRTYLLRIRTRLIAEANKDNRAHMQGAPDRYATHRDIEITQFKMAEERERLAEGVPPTIHFDGQPA